MKKPSLVRTTLLVVSLLLQLPTLSFQAHGAPGDVDLSFDPGSGVNGWVTALAEQTDGKIIVGGSFTMVKGLPRRGLARLNADGSGDSTFDPGTNLGNGGFGIALPPDGKVLIAGSITISNGAARNAIARLHADGSLDTTFNPSVEPYSSVHAMVIQADGKIIIGGYFSRSDGTSHSGIAQLNTNGTADSSFTSPNFDGRVSALALQPDGSVVIGGGFTHVGGTSRMGIARLIANGSLMAISIPAAERLAGRCGRSHWTATAGC